MTTLDTLVNMTRRRLLSDLREEYDNLVSNVPANATSLNLQNGSGLALGSIRAGSLLEVDYELYFVTSTPVSIGAISVIPGYYGSPSTAHAAGAVVTVNPRVPRNDLIDAINEDIDDLSAPANGLYRMLECTLVYNPVRIGYDLPGVKASQVLEIFEVRNQDYGPAQAWPLLAPRKYKLERNADPVQFPSGISLKFYGAGYPGRPIRVQYKAAFNSNLANPSDDVTLLTGLHPEAHDIPTLGAAIRLVEYRDIKRSFSEAQSEPRRAQEVPVGASMTSLKGLLDRRTKRIEAERARLDKQYPRQLR